MSKKTFFTAIASFIGFVSIFMPWFAFKGYSLNAVSEHFNDGYFFGAMFLAILVITLYSSYKNVSSNKLTIATIAISAFIVVFSILDIFVNKKLLDMGASVGIGAYVSIFSSGFIAIYTVYNKKNASKDVEMNFDKDKVVSMAKKGADVTVAVASVTGDAIKSAVSQVKSEIDKKNDNNKSGKK